MIAERMQYRSIISEYWNFKMMSLALLLLIMAITTENGSITILIGKNVKVTPPMNLS